jgi:hypothetical protein
MALSKKPKYPVFCPQGKTFTATGRFTDKYNEVSKLEGCTATCEIRAELPDPEEETQAEPVVSLSTESGGGIVIDEDSGTVTVTIEADVTATLEVGTYIWELEITFPNGYVPYFMAPSPFKVIAEANLA